MAEKEMLEWTRRVGKFVGQAVFGVMLVWSWRNRSFAEQGMNILVVFGATIAAHFAAAFGTGIVLWFVARDE